MDSINHSLLPLWNLSADAPRWLVAFARVASHELSQATLLCVFGWLILGESRWRRLALQALLSMAITWLIVRGIHSAWPQPRPFMLGLGHQWIEHARSPGFPSRHAAMGLAFGVTALVAAPRRWVGVSGAVAGGLIAWSRVALGVHFPLDVVAGVLIATVVALAVHAAWPRLIVQPTHSHPPAL